MSFTGPGCAACSFTGYAPRFDEAANAWEDDMPCDACGGFSWFRHRDEDVSLVPAVSVAREQRATVAPEDDWRPLPSVAEVLAHNARTGGDCFGPWLCAADSDDGYDTARVVMLCVVSLDTGDEVSAEVGGVNLTANPAARWRPITRRGGALPWPEVPR